MHTPDLSFCQPAVAGNNHRRSYNILAKVKLLFCFLPVIFGIWFCIDVGDYFVNGETATGPNVVSVKNRAAKFASFLAYFRSQFSAFRSATTLTAFLFRETRIRKVKLHINKLVKLFFIQKPSLVERTTTDVYFQKYVWVLFTILMITTFTRQSYLVYSVFISHEDFLEHSTISYFVWTVRRGYLSLAMQLLLFLEELSMLYVYRVIILDSTSALNIFGTINQKLRVAVHNCEKSSMTCASFAKLVLSLLIDLENTSVQLIRDLDCAFRSVIGCSLIGNSLVLSSIISQCFLSGSFETAEDYCLFISVITQLVLAMTLTLAGFAEIHSKVSLS